MDWINENLFITIIGDEIIFPIDSNINILTPIISFIDFFGSTIEEALMNGADVIQGIKDSDPENILGFNFLL